MSFQGTLTDGKSRKQTNQLGQGVPEHGKASAEVLEMSMGRFKKKAKCKRQLLGDILILINMRLMQAELWMAFYDFKIILNWAWQKLKGFEEGVNNECLVKLAIGQYSNGQ